MFFKRLIIKKYRKKLRKIKDRFNTKLRDEINNFISILNHDIKTPIIAQNQSLEYVLKNLPDNFPENQKEILNEILNSNAFLLDIVSNTIFLAEYENEKPKLKLENVDIIEQIQDCTSLIKNHIKDKQQNIIIKSNKNKNISLSADRILIQKIIFNLLVSSVNFGFEKSDIEILVKENKKQIYFCAKNKSIYMTKEKIKSLFESKKNMRDFNQLGMSLNLNIAKKLISAHKWDIIAKSDKNNSGVFGFVVKK